MVNTNITRYFVINPKDFNRADNRMQLLSDDDVLPLTDLQAVEVGSLTDGRIVVHVLLTSDVIIDMMDQAELADPLSLAGVVALGIGGKYVGMDANEVKQKYPELAGQVEVGKDDDGKSIMVDKLMAHQWGA